VIQSSGDSYTPSHIFSPARDVGQSWKSELGLGEDFEVPVNERLSAEVPGRVHGSREQASFVPLALGY